MQISIEDASASKVALSCIEARQDLFDISTCIEVQEARLTLWRKTLDTHPSSISPGFMHIYPSIYSHLENCYRILRKKIQTALATPTNSMDELRSLTQCRDDAFYRWRFLQPLSAVVATSVNCKTVPQFPSQWFQQTASQSVTENSDDKAYNCVAANAYGQAFIAQNIDILPGQVVRAYVMVSGMAAMAAAVAFLEQEGLVKESVLVGRCCWFENMKLFHRAFSEQVRVVDDECVETFLEKISEHKPSVIFLESSSSDPEMRTPDVRKLIPLIAKCVDRPTTLVIDNTCMGVTYQPFFNLPHGPVYLRIMVVESLAKYHQFGADCVTGGILLTLGDDFPVASMINVQNDLGSIMPLLNVYTLPKPDRQHLEKRMYRMGRNAISLAKQLHAYLDEHALEGYPKIIHPCLPGHSSNDWLSTYSFQAGRVMLIMPVTAGKSSDIYKRIAHAAIDEAKIAGVSLIEGSSFGFDITRICVPYREEFLRVSTGIETLVDIERVGVVLIRAISRVMRDVTATVDSKTTSNELPDAAEPSIAKDKSVIEDTLTTEEESAVEQVSKSIDLNTLFRPAPAFYSTNMETPCFIRSVIAHALNEQALSIMYKDEIFSVLEELSTDLSRDLQDIDERCERMRTIRQKIEVGKLDVPVPIIEMALPIFDLLELACSQLRERLNEENIHAASAAIDIPDLIRLKSNTQSQLRWIIAIIAALRVGLNWQSPSLSYSKWSQCAEGMDPSYDYNRCQHPFGDLYGALHCMSFVDVLPEQLQVDKKCSIAYQLTVSKEAAYQLAVRSLLYGGYAKGFVLVGNSCSPKRKKGLENLFTSRVIYIDERDISACIESIKLYKPSVVFLETTETCGDTLTASNILELLSSMEQNVTQLTRVVLDNSGLSTMCQPLKAFPFYTEKLQVLVVDVIHDGIGEEFSAGIVWMIESAHGAKLFFYSMILGINITDMNVFALPLPYRERHDAKVLRVDRNVRFLAHLIDAYLEARPSPYVTLGRVTVKSPHKASYDGAQRQFYSSELHLMLDGSINAASFFDRLATYAVHEAAHLGVELIIEDDDKRQGSRLYCVKGKGVTGKNGACIRVAVGAESRQEITCIGIALVRALMGCHAVTNRITMVP